MKKKLIALTMSVLMAVSLSACGGGSTKDTTAAASTAEATTKAEDTTAADAEVSTEKAASDKV